MKIILQRVSEANVEVNEKVVGQIGLGYLLFIGFTHTDTEQIAEKMAQKIANLRIMADENDRLNLTLAEKNGQILAIPQFTLYADTSGRRPSFKDTAKPGEANRLFDYFVTQLVLQKLDVEKGVFGAHMIVGSKNDGPLTINLEM